MLRETEKFLSNLLVFTARESEFIDKFRKREYNPELLFDDSQIVERIRHHPMALWKTK